MRKVIVQIQLTIDGFMSGPNGEIDWVFLPAENDDAYFQKINDLADSCDTILLGRKMLPGFTEHWENVVDNQPDSPMISLAQRMVNMHKIAFSHTKQDFKGRNLEVENGDLATAVQALKNQPGKDLLVYGGVDFIRSLVNLNLVDEFYFFVSPIAIGSGLSIFKDRQIMKLESSTAYKNGKILNKYVPVKG